MEKGEQFLRKAIELAYNNIEKGGRPFGAVVVKNGEIIASGVNQILVTNDPTAHAELLAIRAASQVLGSAKPFAEQSMKIQYIPIRVENRTDLYAHWKNYQANHSGSK